MKDFDLEVLGVQELNRSELVEVDGGKKFWETVGGKLVMAFLVGFATTLGVRAANGL